MLCPKCGSVTSNESKFCEVCGESLHSNEQHPVAQDKVQNYPVIKDYMVFSVLVLAFCSKIFGAIALANSSKVSALLYSGDITEAMEVSKKAKKWCIVALILGILKVVAIVLSVILFSCIFMMSYGSGINYFSY